MIHDVVTLAFSATASIAASPARPTGGLFLFTIISRRPGPSPERAVTVIASNHGKAVLGAGHFLSLEKEVAKLLCQMRVGDRDPLPAEFQIIMRVDMIDFDDEVVNVEYVTHRFPEEGPGDPRNRQHRDNS